MEYKVQHMTYLGVTAVGLKETVGGFLDISDGNIVTGAKKVLVGMSAVNMGGRLDTLDSADHADLMKYTLVAGTSAVAAQGVQTLSNGIAHKNLNDLITGIAKVTIGAASTSSILSLNSRIIVNEGKIFAQQIRCLSQSSL